MVLRLLLMFTMCSGFFSAAEAAETKAAEAKADERTIAFIKSFVEIPVEQIPPDRVGDFMKVSLDGLPVKLREKALARKLELHALRDLAEHKRKGSYRQMEPKCPINDEAKSDDPQMLKLAGFVEISEGEETHIESETNCNQRELMCEFSLQILLKKDKQGKPAGKRYFIHPNDALMALVTAFRGEAGEGQSYGKPTCAR